MSPELGTDSLPEGMGQKFVRVGQRIVFHNVVRGVGHDQIALKCGLIKKIPNEEKPIVDDGGTIVETSYGVILVGDTTTTCLIAGKKEAARQTTIELIRSLTEGSVRKF